MAELIFNRGDDRERKTGLDPQVPYSYAHGYGDNPAVIKRDDGLFDRSDIDPDFLARMNEQIETDPGSVTLLDWRLWLQHAWKSEHGSPEAAQRFSGKLMEEYKELTDALRIYRDDPNEQARQEAVSEAGDVLWCLVAGLTNAGGKLDTGLRELLLKTALGTARYEYKQNAMIYPPWREQMIAAATSAADVTIGDIDGIFAQRYLMGQAPAMNDYELVGEFGADIEVFSDFRTDGFLASIVAINLTQQYAPDQEDDNYYVDRRRHQEFIQEMSPYLMIRVLSTMNAMMGASFAEIMTKNYKKVMGRVEAGRIDRTDGERTEDLL